MFLVNEESRELKQQELILNVYVGKRIELERLINVDVEEYGRVSKSIYIEFYKSLRLTSRTPW